MSEDYRACSTSLTASKLDRRGLDSHVVLKPRAHSTQKAKAPRAMIGTNALRTTNEGARATARAAA
jgi:hypothetical protein